MLILPIVFYLCSLWVNLLENTYVNEGINYSVIYSLCPEQNWVLQSSKKKKIVSWSEGSNLIVPQIISLV